MTRKVNPDGWSQVGNRDKLRAEHMGKFDKYLVGSVDGVDGGSYLLEEPIDIGGAGVSLEYVACRKLTTVSSGLSVDQNGSNLGVDWYCEGGLQFQGPGASNSVREYAASASGTISVDTGYDAYRFAASGGLTVNLPSVINVGTGNVYGGNVFYPTNGEILRVTVHGGSASWYSSFWYRKGDFTAVELGRLYGASGFMEFAALSSGYRWEVIGYNGEAVIY